MMAAGRPTAELFSPSEVNYPTAGGEVLSRFIFERAFRIHDNRALFRRPAGAI